MNASGNGPPVRMLGRVTPHVNRYDPTLLDALPRAPMRERLGLAEQPGFLGADLWTAYELSWLNRRGKPQVALAHIMVPCQSTHLIESKSLKLYLNSFSGTAFASAADVQERMAADLAAAAWRGATVGSGVVVRLVLPDAFAREPVAELAGVSLDRLDLDCPPCDAPAPELLRAAFDEKPVTEVLASQLLKSNCPVTGQPDWGSVQISYSGPQIDQAGLLRYIVSFREFAEFHENCVERMFVEIQQRCRPSQLAVYARYTRRGGLDINPWRSSHPGPMPAQARTARQ